MSGPAVNAASDQIISFPMKSVSSLDDSIGIAAHSSCLMMRRWADVGPKSDHLSGTEAAMEGSKQWDLHGSRIMKSVIFSEAQDI